MQISKKVAYQNGKFWLTVIIDGQEVATNPYDSIALLDKAQADFTAKVVDSVAQAKAMEKKLNG